MNVGIATALLGIAGLLGGAPAGSALTDLACVLPEPNDACAISIVADKTDEPVTSYVIQLPGDNDCTIDGVQQPTTPALGAFLGFATVNPEVNHVLSCIPTTVAQNLVCEKIRAETFALGFDDQSHVYAKAVGTCGFNTAQCESEVHGRNLDACSETKTGFGVGYSCSLRIKIEHSGRARASCSATWTL